ncbi:MAG: hypothetical protein GYA60_07755 [Candidatus Methanofastidiosa archaeon]|nr:hypothetical protein [Candidatus Methanofastidiosa archaeon]
MGILDLFILILRIILNLFNLDWSFITGVGTLMLALAAVIGIIFNFKTSKQNQKLIEEESYTRIQEVETRTFPKIRLTTGKNIAPGNVRFKIFYYEELFDLEIRLFNSNKERIYPELCLVNYSILKSDVKKEDTLYTLQFFKENSVSIKFNCPYRDTRNNKNMSPIANVITINAQFNPNNYVPLKYIYLKLNSLFLNEYIFLYEDASGGNLYFRRMYVKYPWKNEPWIEASCDILRIHKDKLEIKKNKLFESGPPVELKQ